MPEYQMKRFKKAIPVLIFLIALGSSALLALLFIVPQSDLIKNNLQDQLRASTGYEAQISHIGVRPSLSQLLTIQVNDLSIRGAGGKDLVSVASISFCPSWLPLFSGELSISSIRIYGLKATIQRAEDGAVSDFVIPAPVSSPAIESPKSADSNAPAEAPRPQRKLKWSIDRIDLADAQVKFIDKAIRPGQEAVLLATLNGSMKRTESENGFSADFTGSVGSGKAQAAPLKIDGVFHLTPDLAAVADGKAQISAQSLPISLLEPYIPQPASIVGQFASTDVMAQVTFSKDRPSRIQLKSSMFIAEKQPKNLDIDVELLTDDRSSGVEEVKGAISVESLPTRLFKGHVPGGAPIDLESGTLKGMLRGQWNKDAWKAEGRIELADVITKGIVKNSAPALHASAELRVDQSKFEITRLDVSDGKHKISAEGVVSHPLDANRSVDLKLNSVLVPDLLKTWGVHLPKGLKFSGAVPIKGELRGAPEALQVEVGAALKEADIGWEDYIEKGKGAPGSINARASLILGAGKPQWKPIAVKLNLAEARLGTPQQKPLKAAVLLDTQVVLKGNAADLRAVSLQLKRGNETPDSIHGEALNLGSQAPSFDGSASVTVDPELIEALRQTPPELAISGRAPLKAKFSGAPGKLTLSAEAALANLGVSLGKDFKKPAGVPGALKASLRVADQSIDLTDGTLTLPGVLINGKGALKDKTGKFHDVNLEIKKCELRELAKLFPQISAAKPAGSVEGHVDLKPLKDRIAPFGIVRMSGVELRPENLGAHFSGIKGSLEASGGAVNITEISGVAGGAVDAPFTIKGTLENIQNGQDMSGKLTLHGGPGHIRSPKIKEILQKASLLMSIASAPGEGKKIDPLGFEVLTGAFELKNGAVSTDNLKFKGATLNAGAVGNLTLKGSDLDVFMGFKTMTTLGSAIGRIPAVRNVLKQNEGLLKSTGLDKELKRWGINVSEEKKQEDSDKGAGSEGDKQDSQPKATAVTLFLRIRGPAASPEVRPVVESQAGRTVMDKLKPLID
jgi:hypothetical protein